MSKTFTYHGEIIATVLTCGVGSNNRYAVRFKDTDRVMGVNSMADAIHLITRRYPCACLYTGTK
jgi:hypothetical protein